MSETVNKKANIKKSNNTVLYTNDTNTKGETTMTTATTTPEKKRSLSAEVKHLNVVFKDLRKVSAKYVRETKALPDKESLFAYMEELFAEVETKLEQKLSSLTVAKRFASLTEDEISYLKTLFSKEA